MIYMHSVGCMPVGTLSVSVDMQGNINKIFKPSVVVIAHNTRWLILQTQYFM